jgi:peptidoglycan/LPS O-acetylase OafA/YrhL
VKYRPEIDGLRAAAVLAVVFFHADIGAFAGGYIGVDVFFAISGYLITSIIVHDLREDRFSFGRFYERRARRILPPLFLVLLASVPLAWSVLSPGDLRRFSTILASAVLFCSNIFFAAHSDYFHAAGWRDPLLHTWSLAVEEQFYLLFPFLLVWAWRRRPSYLRPLVWSMFFASLAAAEGMSRSQPIAAFYILPTRLWELMAGSLLALDETKNGPVAEQWWGGILCLAGLAMIATAVAIFGPATRHPSLLTLLPILGTALVIRYGQAPGLAKRILTFPPLVQIGLISYSLYLWHRPIFTFFHLVMGPPTAGDIAALLALSFALSFASWKWVESPCRNRSRISWGPLLAALSAAGLVLLGLGLLGIRRDVYADRLPPQVRKIMDYDIYDFQDLFRVGSCFIDGNERYSDFKPGCFEPEGRPPKITLWGDSHAAGLYAGLAAAYGKDEVAQVTLGGCSPVACGHAANCSRCGEINELVLERLLEEPPHLILLESNWSNKSVGCDTDDFYRTLALTVSRLREGGYTVVVCGTMPVWDPMPRQTVARMMIRHEQVPSSLVLNSRAALDRIDGKIRAAVVPEGAHFLPLLPMVCQGQNCVALTRVGREIRLLTYDDEHLTIEGSAFYGPKIKRALESMFPKAKL